MVLKKHQWSSSITSMVHDDYHWQLAYTWIRGGEEFILPGLLTPPVTSQSSQLYDTLHLPTVVQTYKEGNNH